MLTEAHRSGGQVMACEPQDVSSGAAEEPRDPSSAQDPSSGVWREEAEYYKGRYVLLLSKMKETKSEAALWLLRDVMRLWQVWETARLIAY